MRLLALCITKFINITSQDQWLSSTEEKINWIFLNWENQNYLKVKNRYRDMYCNSYHQTCGLRRLLMRDHESSVYSSRTHLWSPSSSAWTEPALRRVAPCSPPATPYRGRGESQAWTKFGTKHERRVRYSPCWEALGTTVLTRHSHSLAVYLSRQRLSRLEYYQHMH